MNYNEVVAKLKEHTTDKPIKLVKIDSKYYGFYNEYPAFAVISSDTNSDGLSTSYKLMDTFTNVFLEVDDNTQIKEIKIHLAVLRTTSESEINIFFKVLNEVIDSSSSDSDFNEAIETLIKIFDKKNPNDLELVGLYGELLTICNLNGVTDIGEFYHSDSFLKFDFSISEEIKIEVKTTRGQDRVHHFKHNQLNPSGIKVLIASVMLQKDDKGKKLSDLIERVLKNNRLSKKNKLYLLKYSEIIKSNPNLDVAFNEKYSNDRFKVFDSYDAPKFKEVNVNGVSNAEYDVSFENLKELTKEEIALFIKV
jgi:hypothetical protein